MWIKQSDRKELIEVLSGNGADITQGCYSSDSFPADPIIGEDLYLVWGYDPGKYVYLPMIIIVADGHLRDFLAWASTYFPGYRPFTAYFRVLDFKTVTSLKGRFERPSLDGVDTGCVGLIIGEALTLSADLSSQGHLTVIACSSTISYCFARALAFGAKLNELDLISEKWVYARKITEQPARKLEINSVKDIWNALALLKSEANQDFGKPRVQIEIIEACSQLKRNGVISAHTWDVLTKDVEELRIAQKEMTAPREERVRFFQKLVYSKSFQKLHDYNMQSFVCGYLASLIGPGSMSHIDLVAQQVAKWPTVLMWYGLCAGLHRKSELLSSFNVLGRRILRELLKVESVLTWPSADIAVSELEILLKGDGKLNDFRTFSSNHVIVELFPLIHTYISWPKRDIGRQQELFPKIPISVDLLSKLRMLLEEAIEVQRHLAGSMESYKPSENKSVKKMRRKGRSKKSGSD